MIKEVITFTGSTIFTEHDKDVSKIIKQYNRTHPKRKLYSNDNVENKATLVEILPYYQGKFQINLR